MKDELAESEKAWFADYYGSERFHPLGLRLRMQRDLRLLRKAAGTTRLGRVLSIGCGDGRFERMVARHAESVTGIDLSPEAIELARRGAREEGLTNLDFAVVSATEFAWDRPFDTVLCVAFLHHLPEAEVPGFLRRIYEHTAPGGFLFTLDPNAGAITRRVGRVVLGSRYHRYHTPDERELDPQETAATLRAAGFGEVRLLPNDLTLIPAMYLLADGPGWPLHLCDWIDRVACALPVASLASGFSAIARRLPAS